MTLSQRIETLASTVERITSRGNAARLRKLAGEMKMIEVVDGPRILNKHGQGEKK